MTKLSYKDKTWFIEGPWFVLDEFVSNDRYIKKNSDLPTSSAPKNKITISDINDLGKDEIIKYFEKYDKIKNFEIKEKPHTKSRYCNIEFKTEIACTKLIKKVHHFIASKRCTVSKFLFKEKSKPTRTLKSTIISTSSPDTFKIDDLNKQKHTKTDVSPKDNKITVTNIGDLTKDKLIKYFKKYGTIINFEIKKNSRTKSRFCNVEFKRESVCTKLMKKKHHLIGSKRCTVLKFSSKEKSKLASTLRSKRLSNSAQSNFKINYLDKQKPVKTGMLPKDNKIIVTDFGELTKDKLIKYFKRYGTIVNFEIMEKYPENFKSCVIEYKTNKMCRASLKKTHYLIGTKECTVSKFPLKEKSLRMANLFKSKTLSDSTQSKSKSSVFHKQNSAKTNISQSSFDQSLSPINHRAKYSEVKNLDIGEPIKSLCSPYNTCDVPPCKGTNSSHFVSDQNIKDESFRTIDLIEKENSSKCLNPKQLSNSQNNANESLKGIDYLNGEIKKFNKINFTDVKNSDAWELANGKESFHDMDRPERENFSKCMGSEQLRNPQNYYNEAFKGIDNLNDETKTNNIINLRDVENSNTLNLLNDDTLLRPSSNLPSEIENEYMNPENFYIVQTPYKEPFHSIEHNDDKKEANERDFSYIKNSNVWEPDINNLFGPVNTQVNVDNDQEKSSLTTTPSSFSNTEEELTSFIPLQFRSRNIPVLITRNATLDRKRLKVKRKLRKKNIDKIKEPFQESKFDVGKTLLEIKELLQKIYSSEAKTPETSISETKNTLPELEEEISIIEPTKKHIEIIDLTNEASFFGKSAIEDDRGSKLGNKNSDIISFSNENADNNESSINKIHYGKRQFSKPTEQDTLNDKPLVLPKIKSKMKQQNKTCMHAKIKSKIETSEKDATNNTNEAKVFVKEKNDHLELKIPRRIIAKQRENKKHKQMETKSKSPMHQQSLNSFHFKNWPSLTIFEPNNFKSNYSRSQGQAYSGPPLF